MARHPLFPYRGGGTMGGFDPLFSLHREMNRLFDDVLGAGPPALGAAGQMLSAQVSVAETEDALRVEAELPGVAEEDVEVSLQEDVLTIRGEKRAERRDEKESHHLVERSFGTFQRAIRLPFPVEADKVQAEMRNGVLTVTLPKSARAERSRRIPVARGGARIEDQRRQTQGQTMQGEQPGGPRQAGGRQKGG